MDLLESLRNDVEGLYQRVTGEQFPRDRFSRAPAPLPPQVEPISFLRQELEQLKAVIHHRLTPEDNQQTRRWIPVTEAFEEAGRYIVRMELPGMTKDDIQLSVGDNVVRIDGERKFTEQETTRVLSCERIYGAFERWITFPFRIKKEDLFVQFKNGLLEIVLNKADRTNGSLETVEIN